MSDNRKGSGEVEVEQVARAKTDLLAYVGLFVTKGNQIDKFDKLLDRYIRLRDKAIKEGHSINVLDYGMLGNGLWDAGEISPVNYKLPRGGRKPNAK